MKLTSKYFDSIRVKPEDDRTKRPEEALCNWKGCQKPANFPAPKGREKEGEYYLFCREHVREYNKKYNYFVGMDQDDIVDYQKSASTGHRPTWSSNDKVKGSGSSSDQFSDPHMLFDEDDESARPTRGRRRLRNMERKSLGNLGLGADATKDDVKARYKELVKRYHPDLNGGDRDCEDKLCEVIAAYNYLKKVGMV